MNSLDVFHLSGWYNLASLRKVVVTSLLGGVKLIPSTLKGLVENREYGDIYEKEEEEEVIEGEENF